MRVALPKKEIMANDSLADALDTARIQAVLAINRNDIQSEYIALPAELGFYCGVASSSLDLLLAAKGQLDRAEEHLKDMEFELEVQYREHGKPASGKITEGWVEASVRTDPRYRRARDGRLSAVDEVSAAEVIRSRVQGVVKALETKRDMLISLGADVRAERLPPPLIKDL